jgi:cytochrome c-type biogenesis protein CcmH
VKRRNLARAAALAGLCAVALAGAARAEDDATWGYALADELMSPWCPGFALPDCASGYASDLRLWILEQERLGRSEEDVKAEILARYGERMLQAPKAEGRGVLAYAIPAAVILGGLIVLVTFLRRQAAPALASGVADPRADAHADGAADVHAMSRVDAELARFERTHD